MKKVVCLALMCLMLTSCSMTGKQDIKPKESSDNYRNYYEVFVRSFYDSNDDGIGDLNGVTEKLDYISKTLGADGIWLMPIMPSPTYHKYDVTDYLAIDKQYGTMEDFEKFIKEAHKRNIKVVLDLVVNHTSSEHQWFQSALASMNIEPCGQKVCNNDNLCREHNPYCEYYNFTKEPGDGYVKATEKYYYEARFSNKMPDLNLDSPKVRAEISKIVKFWLDKNVDGFRLDAVTYYYTGNVTKNVEFLKYLNDTVKAINKNAYIVGEAWTDNGSILDYYKSGVDSFFNFGYSQAEGHLAKAVNTKTGKSYVKSIIDWQKTLLDINSKAIDAPFLSNHDNGRSSGFLFRDIVKEKLAASMYILMPGNPFIYYGEELGMNGSGKDDNKRLPFLWSNFDKKGITYAPPNANQSVTDIKGESEQEKDKNSLLNFYKRVLTVKNKYPEIAKGVLSQINIQEEAIAAYSITYNNEKVHILHNLSDEAYKINLQDCGLKGVKIKDYLDTNGQKPTVSNDILTMPPCSTVILK